MTPAAPVVTNPEELESLKCLVHPKLAALAAQLYPQNGYTQSPFVS